MTQTITLPQIIDASGNITLPGRAGFIIDVPFQLADGTPDITAVNRNLRFEIEGVCDRALLVGLTNDIRRIVIYQSDMAKVGLSDAGKNYNLLDYSQIINSTDVPIPLLWGVITAFGYNKAPPVDPAP